MGIVKATPLHLVENLVRMLAESILSRRVTTETPSAEDEVRIHLGVGTVYLQWQNPHSTPKGTYHLEIRGHTENLRTPQAMWYVRPFDPLWRLVNDLYTQASFYATLKPEQMDASEDPLANVYVTLTNLTRGVIG